MNNEIPETKSKKKSDDCIELKNIKYQTMLINNNMKVTDISTAHIDHITNFLNQEKQHHKTLPWSKLGSGTKLKKINEYIEVFSNKHNYSKIQKKLDSTIRLHCLSVKTVRANQLYSKP